MKDRLSLTNKQSQIIALLFLIFFTLVISYFWKQTKKLNDDLIAQHIEKLSTIFQDINNSSKIVSFEHKKDNIDFLTVKSFVGNTVESMTLLEPQNWRGPYLDQTLTIEGVDYKVLLTNKGYFIVPGDGVKLSNGVKIGKNLILNSQADIEELVKTKLRAPNGKPLAARIQTTENPDLKPLDDIIAGHINKLKNIFDKISKTCGINAFRHNKDYIDFLNVKEFTGSIVGSMNLVDPKKWAGPYLKENLTLNGKYYQIIKTKNGYYICPPNSIKLKNGQVIGQTLVINQKTDIESLIKSPKYLLYNNKPLAAKIIMANEINSLNNTDFLDEEDTTEI